jgi:hypothetical protein
MPPTLAVAIALGILDCLKRQIRFAETYSIISILTSAPKPAKKRPPLIKRAALYLRVSSKTSVMFSPWAAVAALNALCRPETQLYDLRQLMQQRGYEIVEGSRRPLCNSKKTSSRRRLLKPATNLCLREQQQVCGRDK